MDARLAAGPAAPPMSPAPKVTVRRDICWCLVFKDFHSLGGPALPGPEGLVLAELQVQVVALSLSPCPASHSGWQQARRCASGPLELGDRFNLKFYIFKAGFRRSFNNHDCSGTASRVPGHTTSLCRALAVAATSKQMHPVARRVR